jgi:transitional endoplasmic reticulum ATPase
LTADQPAESSLLPAWAEDLRQKYLRGEYAVFIVFGNVYDIVLHKGEVLSIRDFLSKHFLGPSRDTIVAFDPAQGIEVLKGDRKHPPVSEADSILPADALSIIEDNYLDGQTRTGLLLSYSGAIMPSGDPAMLASQDRTNAVRFHQWSMSARFQDNDNICLALCESLPELNPILLSNPHIGSVEITHPGQAERAAFIAHINPHMAGKTVELLAQQMAGLRLIQIRQILNPASDAPVEDDERLKLISDLLGPEGAARAKSLAALTKGMGATAIRQLVTTATGLDSDKSSTDEVALLLPAIQARKQAILERECAGLIEFVTSRHDLSAVGGNEDIKQTLAAIAQSLREGDKARAPMGLLFVGAMGCGKTFVAKAFVKSSGIPAIVLKNFRSKWVGSTEANLEKVISLVKALGPIIVVIDEGDRSFGSQSEDSDGGTSSRVIARLKEFMSDTDNRGNVLFILMTNRPDKLDIDIKRAGRLDQKIPFFYPKTAGEVLEVLTALLKREKLWDDSMTANGDIGTIASKLVDYSQAELESIVLMASTETHRSAKPIAETLQWAAIEFLPTRDTSMITLMELLAVSEASRRSMLPEQYRSIDAETLNAMLHDQKRKVSLSGA